MEISTALAGMSPVPGSCTVNISVEFGDEVMIISVLVPNELSDEQKKVLAIGELRALLANLETSHRVVCELRRWCARRDERQKQAMTVAKDIQENLKVLASAITTISAVLNDEKLENAPTRDRAELLVHVAASLRDMAAALGTTAQLSEKLATEGGD